MTHPLVCLVLTGKTLEEDIRLVQKYEHIADVVELRVDFLSDEEQLYVRRFPSLIGIPCILSIRRDIDGGLFTGGEFSRTNLYGRALAFADPDRNKNFAYVDLEEDFQISSIQDAAQAFGVRIIRSFYSLKEPVYNIKQQCDKMRKTGYEIPKICFQPRRLSDIVNLFKEGRNMTDYDHILTTTGPEGLPAKVLSSRCNSYLTYVYPDDYLSNNPVAGAIDPVSLTSLYNFKAINDFTEIYGITGNPVNRTFSPEIHNSGYKRAGLNAVYIPIHSALVSESLAFAESLGIKGMSITNPHKESVLYYLNEQSQNVALSGVCNCVLRKNGNWTGYNTDVPGFKRAFEEFTGTSKLRFRKIALIGAGGVAKSIALVLKQMGARVCVFSRNANHARQLAEKYGFNYSNLEPDCAPLLDEYSSIIIQATNVGMTSDISGEQNDPIPFYSFRGDELLFDVIFKPAITPVMRRASLAGCRVSNGYKMLEYKAYEQFKLFTGCDFENKY